MHCKNTMTKGAARKSCEIRLLRRYQRRQMLGGGLLISLVLICGVSLVIWADIQSYIAEGRALFIANKALVTQEIEKKQAATRRGIIYSELIWRTIGTPNPVNDFRQGRLLLQASPHVVPQLLLADVTAKTTLQSFSRLLAFSEIRAAELTASTGERGELFAGFFFNPEHTFLSISAPSIAPSLFKEMRPGDVHHLVARLAPDIGDLTDPRYLSSLRENRRVFWMPPMVDPLTGEMVLQVAALAFEGIRPFAVFVSNISFDVLNKWLRKTSYGGNFLIIDQAGGLILNSWSRKITDSALSQKVLDSGLWREQLESSAYLYRDGIFVFSEALADTGWIFSYAHSWRTILAARGSIVLMYIASTLLLLGLLWALIYFYLQKILNPLLFRSQRVFDSENLNRTIIATAPYGLCLVSVRSGKILLQNELMRVYDKGDESLSQRFLTLAHDAPVLKNAKIDIHELTVTVDNNERRHLLVNLVPTSYLSEQYLLCSFSDITERKQLEFSLREARAAADAANQAKSSFLAMISHEIRTPLNGILGNLELLSYSPLTELQQDRLKTITNSSRSLLDIINDVLDFSKIEARQMQLEKIQFDVIDLIEQVLSIFLPMADDKELDLYYYLGCGFPRYHIGDPTRFRQIVVNLLSNAIKFTAKGKIIVALEIDPAQDHGKAWMLLRVSDTGIGIPMCQRQEIFRPFMQADVSVTREYGGTGLGLSLCQQLTHLMDGVIEMESESNCGTIFTVKLPLYAVEGGELKAALLQQTEIGVLCESEEWRVHLIVQLQAWGMQVKLLNEPQEWNKDGGVLLLFGATRFWSVMAEEKAIARNVQLVDARENGPRFPILQGNRILVSCYSIDGLQRALLMAGGDTHPTSTTEVSEVAVYQSATANVAEKTAQILVVEDHPVNRELIGEQLRLLGYVVSLAGSADEALQLFFCGEYDLVFTDLSMPGIDGYLLARILRQQGASLPIIAITASAIADERQRCRDAGIDEILLKPMSLQEIDLMVRRYFFVSHSHAPGASTGQKKIPLSKQLLIELECSSETSLAQIRTASMSQCRDLVLQHLHSIKGAFAMQQQVQVVNACRELERECAVVVPANFLDRVEIFQTLIRRILKEMAWRG